MKKILCLVLTLCLCILGTIVVSADTQTGTEDTKQYLDEVFEALMGKSLEDTTAEYYSGLYEVLFVHFDSETASVDEATKEYVYVFAGFELSPALSYGVFGDYIIRANSYYFPYPLGYYVYVPSEDALYTLRQAWVMNLPGVDKIFTESELAQLIGDVTGDGKLTIQDATAIQKFLVNIVSYEIDDVVYGLQDEEGGELSYISDFNRDGERNIKDATEIQRYIAGLPAELG